jgi:small-conductance mechanosensitive channel
VDKWLQHGTAWVIFAAYLVVTWFAAALARRVMKGIIVRLVSRANTTLDERLVKAAGTPVRLMVLTIGLRFGLDSLRARLPYLAASVEFGWTEKALGALVTLAITAMVNALLRAGLDWYLHELAAANKASWDEDLLPVAKRLLSLLLYFIAVSIILKNFGQDITALVTTAGVASLAVALAAQETLSNMLGGFVILVDRPFKVGDVIELADGKSGGVLEIGLRSTRVRLADGNLLVAPNRDLANTRIVNVAQPNQRGAIRGTVGVSYAADVNKAREVLLGVLQAHPEALKEPAPSVWFTRFGESSLELVFSCWVAAAKDRARVTDEVNSRILAAFRAGGIAIAFPQRDVYLHVTEAGH